jgi:hypothetical protein
MKALIQNQSGGTLCRSNRAAAAAGIGAGVVAVEAGGAPGRLTRGRGAGTRENGRARLTELRSMGEQKGTFYLPLYLPEKY